METATSIELFVEILDRYVYYFDQHNEAVSAPAFPFPFLFLFFFLFLLPPLFPSDNMII